MMNSIKPLIALPFVVFALTGACSINNENGEGGSQKTLAEFPASLLSSVEFAKNDFDELKQDESCFMVIIRSIKTGFAIDFIPEPDLDEVDGKILTSRGDSSCGRGVTYEFDANYKFVKNYFHR